MEIKKIDVRQYDMAKAAAALQATAFRYPDRYKQVLTEIEEAQKEKRLLDDPIEQKPSVQPWGAVIEDKLIAMLYEYKFQMHYEDEYVPMSGIGGVASRPENRRQGAVRELMKNVLQQARKQQVLFSYLYPFSFPYYHQFGYDFGCRRVEAEIPFSALLQFKAEGKARLAEKQDWPVIESIYASFAEKTNGAIKREERRWKNLLDHDPYLTQQFTYIWQDSHGRDCAYFIFHKKSDPLTPQHQNTVFEVLDWAVTDPQAIIGMLSFMARFESQYEILKMYWPMHLPLESTFTEINSIKRTLQTYGQIRVIHVEQALKKLHLPSWLPSLACKMAINDPFLQDNTGLYQVSLSHKGNHVFFQPQPITENVKADIYIDAAALASLLLGSRGLQELCTVSAARLSKHLSARQADLLQAFFRQKQACIYDFF